MARKKNNINEKFTLEKDIMTGLYRLKALRDIGSKKTILIPEGSYGGVTDKPELISHEGECWLDYYATAYNTVIKDDAFVGGNAIVKNSVISKEAHVLQNAKVFDSTITDYAQIINNATVKHGCIVGHNAVLMDNAYITIHVEIRRRMILKGNARITGPLVIRFDNLIIEDNCDTDMKSQLLLRYGRPNRNNEYTVYKIVKSTPEDYVYQSCFDENFYYNLKSNNKRIKIKNYNRNANILCSEGIHVVFDDYYDWSNNPVVKQADRILTCKTKVENFLALDRITRHKARVNQIRVTEIRNYPLPPKLPQLMVNHNLNSRFLYPAIYNNKTKSYFFDFFTDIYDNNKAIIKLKIDEDTDNISNYNVVILSALPADMDITVMRPSSHKQNFNFRHNNEIRVNHNFGSYHNIPIIFDLETGIDITSNFIIKMIDTNNLTIRPINEEIMYEDMDYRLLLVKPRIPLSIGMHSDRGLTNATPDVYIKLFMGHECDNDDSITIYHDFNTIDVFGSIYDYDTMQILDGYIFKRIDRKTINIKFIRNLYENHQYGLFLTKC